MVDIGEFQRSVVRLVSLASGISNNHIQLIKGGELPEIQESYCSVQLQSDRTLGTPSPKYAASAIANMLDEQIQVATEFRLSVNFFREGAMQYANNMKSAPWRSEVQQHLYENEMGWLSFGPINNLTGWFSGFYEERAQGNLLLLVDGLDVATVNQALAVDIQLTDHDTDQVFTITAN